MGFLNNLLSDLVHQNTGVNPRRLVRMVGGKNLLMLGAGAALAGGVAALSQQQTRAAPPPPSAAGGPPPPLPQSARAPSPGAPPPPPGAPPPPPGAPPPPPPVPEAAAPPPPPAAGTEDELPQELTYAIVRTLVAAAMADGEMAPEEKEILHKHLAASGLSDDQTRQVRQDLVLPATPGELAQLAAGAEARAALYRFGAVILLADQEVSDLERRWLDSLADAFELSAERKAALEAEIFSGHEPAVPGGEA